MPTEPVTASVNPSPRSGRKYFSIDEANRAIPYVSRIIDDITDVYADVVALRKRIESPVNDDSSDLEPRYEAAMDRLSELVDELHQVGVELKDFEMGLIDFPAIHDEREVFLCWRRGEAAVEYWHEVDTGYSERQSAAVLAAGS